MRSRKTKIEERVGIEIGIRRGRRIETAHVIEIHSEMIAVRGAVRARVRDLHGSASDGAAEVQLECAAKVAAVAAARVADADLTKEIDPGRLPGAARGHDQGLRKGEGVPTSVLV